MSSYTCNYNISNTCGYIAVETYMTTPVYYIYLWRVHSHQPCAEEVTLIIQYNNNNNNTLYSEKYIGPREYLSLVQFYGVQLVIHIGPDLIIIIIANSPSLSTFLQRN